MKNFVLTLILAISSVSPAAGQDPNMKMHTNKPQPQYIEEQCEVTGCGGEICQLPEMNENDELVTTCEYHDYYKCFSIPSCIVQENSCGWDVSDEFVSCLKEYQAPQAVLDRYLGRYLINTIITLNLTLNK